MTQHKLKQIAEQCSEKLKNAKYDIELFHEPYKHCIIDNFLPQEIADECYSSFPPLESSAWDRTDDPDIEIKLRMRWQSEFDIPEGMLPAVRILNSSMFLHSVSEVIDIKKLVPDAYFTGGGLNVTVSGGLLDVHVDGNYHDATGLNRRINAIIYLNPGWQQGWGGELGIYDSTGKDLIKKIAPIFNRLVIFETHDYSFHGLPDPLNFPKDQARRSIILYYYTKGSRPSEQVSIAEPHSALWKKRDFLDKRGNKTRDFQ